MDDTRKHLLSKSTFIRGTQCHKSLYLHRFHPELRDEPDSRLRNVFRSGNEAGLLARDLFPGGETARARDDGTAPGPGEIDDAVARTAELMARGLPAVYEAAFRHDVVLCFMDILASSGDAWHACEVKSSTRVTDVYLLDAALQYYVIRGSGVDLDGVSIAHINRDYVRRGDIVPRSLFTIKPVTERVLKMQESVAAGVAGMKRVLEMPSAPEIEIGEHCFSPYRCDFFGHCWRHMPEDTVFDITRLSRMEKFAMYRSGIVKLDEVPEEYPLKPAQHIQVMCHRTGKGNIERERLGEFIAAVRYPVTFMDFETFMPAVPLYDGTRPYQQIPFQYSVHLVEKRGGAPDHRDFLAGAGGDPRREFLERLLGDTGEEGAIMVYNRAFEERILRELAWEFPVHGDAIGRRIERLCDLMTPFREKHYYLPAMKGRFSIKNVLPALVPDMDYGALAISDGFMAMSAYARLRGETDAAVIRAIRGELLEYCGMDTLAMVKILEQLEAETGAR
jgi:hypothetical protein